MVPTSSGSSDPAPPPPEGGASRLDLKVGFSCNNRCVFCVQGDKRDRFEDRTTEELYAILEERRAHADSVVLTGGEASIRKDIVDLVRRAAELGYTRIQLQTNGRRLAYRPFVRAMVAAGLTEVSPALHGSYPALHDMLTGARGAFMQVVQGIKHCVAAGLPVITNTVVVKDNVRDLPALARLLVNLKVVHMQLAYVHPAGTAGTHFDAVVPRFEEAIPHIHHALDIARAAGLRAWTEAIPYCFMGGYEDHVVEGHIPDTCVVDAELVLESYTAYRHAEGKAHGPPCAACTHARLCEGPWHEYPQTYGWEAFTPRTDAPAAGLA